MKLTTTSCGIKGLCLCQSRSDILTLFQLPSSVLVACYPLTHHFVSYFVLLTTCFGCLLHFFAACTKSQVYIEALVLYRIDKVFILVVRFNRFKPGPSTA